MLAIPKFARAVTIGYRLDMMAKSKYKYEKTLNSLPRGRVATMKRYAGSQIITRCVQAAPSRSTHAPLIIEPLIIFQDICYGVYITYDSYYGASSHNYQRHTDKGFRFYNAMNDNTKILSVDCIGICLCS